MATYNKKPTHTLPCANIRASIWQNASESGPFFATTFTRSFKDSPAHGGTEPHVVLTI